MSINVALKMRVTDAVDYWSVVELTKILSNLTATK